MKLDKTHALTKTHTNYVQGMEEELSKYENDKFIVVLKDADVWLLRAVAVCFLVLVIAQTIIFIKN